MDDLIKLLPGLLKSLPEIPEVRQPVVFALWRRAAGEGLKQHAIPISLEGSRLAIAVRDKIWKRHMKAMAPQLLFRLNSLLDSAEVDFLDFRIDETRFTIESPDKSVEPEVDPQEAPKELQEKAKLIKDPSLRDGFLASAAVYLKMQEKRKRT